MRVLLINGVEIGHLEDAGLDQPWRYGIFHALPAFETNGGPIRELEAAWKAIDQEDLTEEESDRRHDHLYELQETVDRMLSLRDPSGLISGVSDFRVVNGRWEYKWFTGAQPSP
jgi:hypothetical protein